MLSRSGRRGKAKAKTPRLSPIATRTRRALNMGGENTTPDGPRTRGRSAAAVNSPLQQLDGHGFLPSVREGTEDTPKYSQRKGQ